MDSLINDFLQESNENLNRLDHEFVALEKDPENRELLGSIFRTIHTIKGTCGFLGFLKLESLAHVGENLLSMLRAGELALNPTIADTLLEMVDAIRGILQEIGNTEKEGTLEYGELIERLKKCQTAKAGEPMATAKPELPAPPQPVAAEQPKTLPDPKPDVPDVKTAASAKPPRLEGTIRVDVNLLENQMNLVSELVLLRNRLLQRSAKAQDHELEATVHGLNLVTSELRKNVMKARMQPVSGLYEKLPRVVRDVSKDLGKLIQLETQGGDTELDKTLLEAIKDPVTHILRNSMDHGIELPTERVAAGKPEQGTIRVRAYHEGGNFHLDLSDDGAGIDVNRVRDKAISKRLITSAQAQKMSEAELRALIFAPGLTTAQKVTNVSGRGVGMDVVKTNIERIGGQVKLESVLGQGTKVHLEIPLTLATIPALSVIACKSAFAIAQAALVEMMCLDSGQARERIEDIDGARMLRFRGAVLPLLSLQREFSLPGNPSSDSEFTNIVVVQAEGRQFALQVDRIRNTEEIVIKPLARQFKKIGLYAGAAVLGDGTVTMILDLSALARRNGMVLNGSESAKQQAQNRELLRRLVLVSASHGERMAIPIEYVERLESLNEDARETIGGVPVMQYRQQIIRLVKLESLLKERRTVQRHPLEEKLEEKKFSAVVVRSNSGTHVIFEVARILGIVNVEVGTLTPPSRAGSKGALVIQEHVCELLDMDFLLQKVASDELSAPELVPAEPGEHNG